jgi:prepilin-type N-terminal cleavage/methylation domain-containing protein
MHKRGFTLVELMIVVAIIALISAIATPNLMRARENAKRAVCVANREALQRAEQLFLSQNERHSGSIEELRATGLYHGAKCPKGGVYFWVEFSGLDDFYQRIMGCSVHGVDTDSEENEQIFTLTLLSSDFSDRAQWQIVRGDWVFKDGTAISKLNSENRAFSGAEDWRNYIVSTDARIVAGKGLGIYFRATDVKQVDGYIFQVDPGLGNKFVFRKLVNGRESSPFAVAAPEGPFDWYAKHNIEIKVENDAFTAYIDGKEVLRASDATYETGMVGIRAWSGSQAEFDNLDVKEQKAP